MKSKNLKITEEKQSVVEPQIMQYPLTYFKQEFSKETYELIDWHWHSGFQFCYVTSGEIIIQTVTRKVTLEEGEGMFIHAQQVHRSMNKNKKAEYISIHLPVHFLGLEGSELYYRFMEPVLHAENIESIVIRKNNSDMERFLTALKICAEKTVHEDSIHSLNLLADLLLLWEELFHQISIIDYSPSKRNGTNKRLQDLLKYLQANYNRKITLQDIADHANLSKSECSRFFKKITGETLFEYLLKYRIEKSIELLRHTDMTITEIAYETGFMSQSYYDQRFRKIKGISPLKYRNSTLT